MAAGRLLVPEFDGCDITNGNRAEFRCVGELSRLQDNALDLIDSGGFGLHANQITALALVDGPGRYGIVGGPQCLKNLWHRQAVSRHLPRLDYDLEFPAAAAGSTDLGDAGNAFDPVRHHVLNEIAVCFDLTVVSGQPRDREPRDGHVVRTGSPKPWIACFVRQVRHAAEAAGNQRKRPVHVLIDIEFQVDSRPAELGLAGYFREARNPGQFPFQPVTDLTFHFGRRGPWPTRGDLQNRPPHVGRQLNWNRLQRDDAERQQHQHSGKNHRRPIEC
jgi:hypothetical protein